jgi:HPt (histidine-containing phosphotransfer) domain-containing protein
MSKALDRSVLDHLRSALGDVSGAFAARLIAKFVSQSQLLMIDLERASEHDDRSGIAFAAHTLRGSSGSVGGRRLADLCDEVEHWQGTAAERAPKVTAVRDELTALTVALEAYP